MVSGGSEGSRKGVKVDRYAGRPLLWLLEWYVLDAIGMLHDDERERLRLMEPHLAKTFKCEGNWREIVNQVMEFPLTLPGEIRENWEKNLALAHSRGQPVVPEEYAQAFVDQNFPHIVSAG